ncbi:uncharacterized protein MONOS_4135 [Monocercomonoides exilis]|uniref:uncharacterized protein n=1 Tax=Monocercomonoides exilis TaxID=2049356 RepID=UPI00355946D0|nr:hypothetical protein MONOS_4135 [Monocercomonoides exilis]|eukprot:MONOS_4135.1-p1 / transcript=MONOS_4135.1 / gene=MONOS_4135 / organism=Monocercomonoides_exilis_PA203 / gene_product=unspecified product / transcript_product=unspecified product / location=Mono_scaffold00106:33769-34659(+) / protein_length=297 / sequence_SO=supercontig / SO=protein_coding / is_pseudo=false
MLGILLFICVTFETKGYKWKYSDGIKSPKIANRLEELGLQDVYIVAPWKGTKERNEIMKALEQSRVPFELFEGVNGKLLYKLCQNDHPDFRSMLKLHKNTTFTYESAKSLMGNITRPYEECGIWQSELQVNFEIVERARRTGQDKPVLLIQSHSPNRRRPIDEIISEMNKLPEEWDIFALGGYPNPCKENIEGTKTCEFLLAERTRTMIVNGQKGAQKLISVYNTATVQNVEVSISLFMPYKIRMFGYKFTPEPPIISASTLNFKIIFGVIFLILISLFAIWKMQRTKKDPNILAH